VSSVLPAPVDGSLAVVAEPPADGMADAPSKGRFSAATAQFEVSAFPGSAELQQVWLDLERRAAAPFYLSWDWIGCWIEEASLRPVVLIGRVDGRIVLLGLLIPTERREHLPITVYGLQLHMTGDPQQDVITIEYNGFMVDSGWAGKIESDAVAFLLRGIVVNGHRRDEVHLKNVPAAFTQTVAESGAYFREVQRKPSWRVDLAAIRAADRQYLDCLSANTRQQIRRSIRLYDKRGALVATRAQSVPEALMFLDGLKELHQRHWSSRGEPGGFAFPFFERFLKRLTRTCLAHGTVEIVKVTAGSDVIGYVYNFVYRRHVYAYLTGIHYERDPRLKPGLVCHCLCIDLHLDNGSEVYDFLAGDHRYKDNLGAPGPDIIYLLAERPTWPLQLENALYRIKQRLGAMRLRFGPP
jgi:CelD/BcsL family acetyltransferase involved in cellulose biosynthesis